MGLKQSRGMSFIEAKANAVLGLVISYLFSLYGLPYFGLETSPAQAGGITACYFFLSLGRGYIIRRVFNGLG